jgi:signal transduction histidine kinase
LVEEALRTSLPTASVTTLDPRSLTSRQLPPALCAVVGPRFGEMAQLDTVRALRAASFEGSLVAIATEPVPNDVVTAARQFGVIDFVPMESLASRLPTVVLDAASAPEDSAAVRELREVQRLIAAGEIALGLQHSLNNPLAAMLAEAQLLEMEPLAEEHLQAVRRMVELCRRLAAIVRRLDAVAPKKADVVSAGYGSEAEQARTSQK